MTDHSMLGVCGVFIGAVASQWSGGGRLHDDAAKAHEL